MNGGLPRVAALLLRLLVPPGLREEIQGDLLERYVELRAERGRGSATWWLWRQMAALRPLALRGLRLEDDAWTTTGGGGVLDGLAKDLGYALRALRRRPGVTTMLVATVAVSVGATTAVYSVVDGVLLRPLPYPDAERIVQVWQTRRDWMDAPNAQLRGFARRFPLSLPTFEDWTREDFGFEAMGAYSTRGLVLDDGSRTTLVDGIVTTSGLFEVLGVEPLIGRRLGPGDDERGAPRAAVLGHALWRDGYDADPAVLGSAVILDGVPHTVVGVTPQGAGLPGLTPDVWIPLPPEDRERARSSQFLGVLAKLSPDVTPDAAGERLVAVQERLERAHPDAQADTGGRVIALLDAVVGDVRTTIWFLFAAVTLVLVIAMVNITNVLTVSGSSRMREMAVRATLGAGAGRLVRLAWLESLVVVGLGGLAGVTLAWGLLPFLVELIPPGVPRSGEIGIAGSVLAFGVGLTGLAAVLVGSVPALRVIRSRPAEALGRSPGAAGGGPSASRLRSSLVTAEVGLAFLLVMGASLLGSSFLNLTSESPGFAADRLVALEVVPDEDATREERYAFLRTVRAALDELPGVSVTATNQVPLTGSTSSSTFELERESGGPESRSVLRSVVLEDYFAVMGIPVVSGRALDASDRTDAVPVAVVNRALADAGWPGRDPVGRRLRNGSDAPWITVVGVVGDVRHRGLGSDPEPKVYLPAWQADRHPESWVLRVDGDVGAAVAGARERIAAISPATPVGEVTVVEETVRRSVALPRFRALFILGLAGVALPLALLGVYGVAAFSVTHRRREIGIRMALGAAAAAVVRAVVYRGLALAAAGVALGLGAGLYGVRFAEEFLYEVEPADPALLASLALGLIALTGLAAWIPARNAARVDPVAVLGEE